MEMRRIAWQMLGGAVVALVVAAPGVGRADIIHRYSFNTDASDSVGGANGTLMGNATVSGGQLVLDGTDSTYVDLSPIGNDIANLTNATFEAWVTWQDPLHYWQRIFDFGMDTTNNMFLTPHPNQHGPRFSITINGGGDEQQVETAAPFPSQVETHIAITLDADKQVASMYVNGQIAGTIYGYTNNPSLLGATANNYLGKSQYADPYFNGSINEFRVYNTALTADQVAASFTGGPDGVPPQ